MPALPWPWRRIGGLIALGTAGFHLAFAYTTMAWLIVLLPFALIGLSRLPRWRMAFYPAVLLGMICYAPKLTFFWTIFGFGAVALWLVLSVWLGFFAVGIWWLGQRLFVGRASAPGESVLLKEATGHPLAGRGRPAYGSLRLLLVAPVLWTALEFFRSELYWLRFAWLTPGMAFDQWPGLMATLGSYGIGFVAALLAAAASLLVGRTARPSRSSGSLPEHGDLAGRPTTTGTMAVLLAALFLTFASSTSAKTVQIAGAQLEFPTHDEVLATLNKLVVRYPQTELVILSEYTFDADPPKSVLKWCRDHSRYLIVGGKDYLPDGSFYNTAFVVSSGGEIIFRQAKKQPIQFFKDGKPAPSQQVWQSPWGRIGIAICYDFSYSRVIDELVEQGAQALIIPTMDVIDWGRTQHETHARLGPIRAAEYGLPVVRVCSSGVSQIVSANGRVEQDLPFDGQGAMFAGTLMLGNAGHLPLDRWLVRGCVALAAVLFTVGAWRRGCSSPLIPTGGSR